MSFIQTPSFLFSLRDDVRFALEKATIILDVCDDNPADYEIYDVVLRLRYADDARLTGESLRATCKEFGALRDFIAAKYSAAIQSTIEQHFGHHALKGAA